MIRYQVGGRVAVVTTFTNEAGALTSPTTVVAEVKAPDGAVTALTPTEQTAGIWRATLPTFNQGGAWQWYIAGTLGLIAADQGTIMVDAKLTLP